MLRDEMVSSRLYTPDDPCIDCRTPTERGQTIFVLQHPDPVICTLLRKPWSISGQQFGRETNKKE